MDTWIWMKKSVLLMGEQNPLDSDADETRRDEREIE